MNRPESFSRDAQRYLDDEPHGILNPTERADADRLMRAGSELAARLAVPAAALDEVVMGEVRRVPGRGRTAWRWFVSPQTIRIRPASLALAAALAGLLLIGERAPRASSPAPAAEPVPTVLVRFVLAAPDARRVSLAGSFNGWQSEGIPLSRDSSGAWEVILPLAMGEHRYQFVVDGVRWVPDPASDALVPDGFGGTNSMIVVGAGGGRGT